MPARRARARRRRRAWCTRGLLFHLSLYFCGLHGAAAWSQVQLCGTSLTQSAEPDLSQLCRARCHSSKSKFLTRLRALYSLWRPVQSQALTSSDWLEQLRRLKCPAPRFLSLVSDFLRRVERDLRGEKTRLNTKKRCIGCGKRAAARRYSVRAAGPHLLAVNQSGRVISQPLPLPAQPLRPKPRQACRYSAETRS